MGRKPHILPEYVGEALHILLLQAHDRLLQPG